MGGMKKAVDVITWRDVRVLRALRDGAHVSISLQPLLRFFADDSRYYLLVLTREGARLFQGTQASFTEVDLERVPASLAAALRAGLRAVGPSALVGAGAGVYPVALHPQSDAADQAAVQASYVRFFREIDRGVCELLEADTAPLLLAGLAFLRDLYREANHYPHLIDGGLDGEPEAWRPGELRRAWSFVAPHVEAARQEVLHRYQGLADVAPERVADTLESVLTAAYQRRVEVLLVPAERHVWGRFSPVDETIEPGREGDPDAYDLLDFAVAHTLLNGGRVYTVAPHYMPGGAPVVAILRY